jgi:hypothetical protein
MASSSSGSSSSSSGVAHKAVGRSPHHMTPPMYHPTKPRNQKKHWTQHPRARTRQRDALGDDTSNERARDGGVRR